MIALREIGLLAREPAGRVYDDVMDARIAFKVFSNRDAFPSVRKFCCHFRAARGIIRENEIARKLREFGTEVEDMEGNSMP